MSDNLQRLRVWAGEPIVEPSAYGLYYDADEVDKRISMYEETIQVWKNEEEDWKETEAGLLARITELESVREEVGEMKAMVALGAATLGAEALEIAASILESDDRVLCPATDEESREDVARWLRSRADQIRKIEVS